MNLALLLPCHSLENFDLVRKEEDAEQVLSAWSALWHPLLLAKARAIPRWLPAATPPQDPTDYLIIVPDCCEASLPEGWLAQAEAVGARALRNLANRDAMVAAALERISKESQSSEAGPLDPDLVADFLALGFCHFQVELLTRKFRYLSNLDEPSFRKSALAAADEALKGDVTAARGHLHAAFDRLHEAREYCYPTPARLLDLTLVAESTLGASLREELASNTPGGADIPVCQGIPRNILAAGAVIEAMAQREPATLDALRQALAANTAALIGGEYHELPLTLLEPEAIELQLRRGLAVYQQHVQQQPKTFGRRRFGLTPILPQIFGAQWAVDRSTQYARRRPLSHGKPESDSMGRYRRHEHRCHRQCAVGRRSGTDVLAASRKTGRGDESRQRLSDRVRPLARPHQPVVRRPVPHRRLWLDPRRVHSCRQGFRADRDGRAAKPLQS